MAEILAPHRGEDSSVAPVLDILQGVEPHDRRDALAATIATVNDEVDLALDAGAGLEAQDVEGLGAVEAEHLCAGALGELQREHAHAGIDPLLVRPKVPVDIVVDHSLQADASGTRNAPAINLDLEYLRNQERFAFLRWCSASFEGVRVVPPGKGIMHQLHLESLGQVVWTEDTPAGIIASPDTCVGVDSHTALIAARNVPVGARSWRTGGELLIMSTCESRG